MLSEGVVVSQPALVAHGVEVGGNSPQRLSSMMVGRRFCLSSCHRCCSVHVPMMLPGSISPQAAVGPGFSLIVRRAAVQVNFDFH